MSKSCSGSFCQTKGCASFIASSLPANPDTLLKEGWKEITSTAMKQNSNSREFYDPRTGYTIRFDKKQPSRTGFAGKDHYHIKIPMQPGKRTTT